MLQMRLLHLFSIWLAGDFARLGGASAAGFLVLALLRRAGARPTYLASGEAVPVIGASAAVSGMMAATARFAFAPGVRLGAPGAMQRARMPAEPLLAVFRNPRALAFILVWFAVNLLFGLTEGLVPGASGLIAWEAHIGGFLAGLFAFPSSTRSDARAIRWQSDPLPPRLAARRRFGRREAEMTVARSSTRRAAAW